MTTIVTRFPPSPTGYLHIGGARTALFNYLFARANGGRFVLRIEDTDQQRSTPEMTQAILDGLDWLGLDFDEGPYFQSERNNIYNEHVDRLVAKGRAYYCECTPEEIEAMRAKARVEGRKPKYDGRCRERGLGPGPGRVVRFKMPLDGTTVFNDLIKGPIAVDNRELDDFVIRRADGSPIYQMAVVVDDALMGVTHVIRGDDHQNNTPKQLRLFEALEYPIPAFGHVPMILGPDKKKMSKRHGATSVMVYREMGYLPQAVCNYLVRLGWAHGDDEIFSREEMVAKFSLDGLGKSASVFDQTKLDWLNSHYIKESTPSVLAPLLAEQYGFLGHKNLSLDYVESIVPLYQPRAKTLKEMAEGSEFFVRSDDDLSYDSKAVAKFLTAETRALLASLRSDLAEVGDFTEAGLEAAMQAFLDRNGQAFKALAQPLRVALTGKTASPGLFETMAVMGRERTLRRLDVVLS
ncbi:MAG: glutamate--tRNA ligase [Deltaproteobacteria bacterium]|nr:glutamate--tRNA ligase [Deltaproteobacteria bacterium]